MTLLSLTSMTKKGLAKIGAGGLLILGCTSVQAVLTENLTIGNAKALALGNAVTADPPGIDSIHFNPAGLAKLRGRQTELKVVSGSFDVTLKFSDHYTPSWTERLDAAQEGAPADYTYDEARGATSVTEGPAVMLPFFGMTKIPVIFAPLGGASYSPPDSRVTFATNVYAPLMVGFSRSKDDPGRFMGEALSYTLISYFSPSVGVQLTDTFAIGGAVTFNYAGAGLKLAFREPNLGLQWLEEIRQGSCDLTGTTPDNFFGFPDLVPCIPESEAIKLYDEMAYHSFEVEQALTFGVNFGFLWDVTPWFHIGAVYQSPIDMDMEGDFVWEQGDSFLHFLQEYDKISPVPFSMLGPLASLVEPVTTGTASLHITLPDHFAIGTSIQVTQHLKINTDLKFTRWSEWEELPVHYSKPLAVLLVTSFIQPNAAPPPIGQTMVLHLGLEDSWNYGIGVEYRWNDRLALRFGFEDRPSSIPKEAESPVMPIGDAKLISIGAEYIPKAKHVFNVALATMHSSINMPGNTSELGNSENPFLLIYNPYSGTDIEANLDVLLFEASYRREW